MKFVFVLMFLCLSSSVCVHANEKPIAAKPIVFVSILPLQYLVQQLVEDKIQVDVLIPAGHSPETYEPLPSQMMSISAAKLFFSIALPIELKLKSRLMNVSSDLQFIDIQKGIDLYQQDDIHTWLDPHLLNQQLNIIQKKLIATFPHLKATISNHYEQLSEKLAQLDKKIQSTVNNDKGLRFLCYHPALSYFSSRYQLQQMSIEAEGKHPSSGHMIDLMSRLKQLKVKYLLVEKQFHAKSVDTVVQTLDLEKIAIDPLAYDYFSNMEYISQSIKKSLF